MEVLRAYHWPGNLGRAGASGLHDRSTAEARVIQPQQLPLRLREPEQWPSLAEYLPGTQKQYIDMVIRACQGDKARAAKVLGVDVSRLN